MGQPCSPRSLYGSPLPFRRLRNLDQIDEVLAGVDTELFVDVADMGANCIERHAEFIGDVASVASSRQKLENVPLARCQ